MSIQIVLTTLTAPRLDGRLHQPAHPAGEVLHRARSRTAPLANPPRTRRP